MRKLMRLFGYKQYCVLFGIGDYDSIEFICSVLCYAKSPLVAGFRAKRIFQ